MSVRLIVGVLVASMLPGASAPAQGRPESAAPLAARFTDAANGLSLDEAITRALASEPALRAARSAIEVARGMRQQAGLHPNPSVSFEQREEPAGTDRLTMVSVEWPLDLFRKRGRTAVADREISATEQAVADRERRLAGEVRMRYGDVLVAVRELGVLDDLVSATRQQRDVLRARVDEGASPALERDLLEVELQRLDADRLRQVGRTEKAVLALKPLLSLESNAPLTLRDTLERVVQHESTALVPTIAAHQQRSDVREAQERVGVADAKIERAQRDGRVDVSVYGTYMRMDAGFSQLGFTTTGETERVRGLFHYVAGGVKVSLPVVNRHQGELAAARAERAGAEASAEAARLTADAEVAAARVADERAREASRGYTAGVRALAQQNLTVVTQSYELGRVTVFDVLAEQRRWLDVERAYTETLRAAYEARTALKLAIGDVQ